MKMSEIHVKPGEYYKCMLCKRHFIATVPKEEVEAEAIENGFQDMEVELVCDPCYILLMEMHDKDPRN